MKNGVGRVPASAEIYLFREVIGVSRPSRTIDRARSAFPACNAWSSGLVDRVLFIRKGCALVRRHDHA
jgi:hypothetical protein